AAYRQRHWRHEWRPDRLQLIERKQHHPGRLEPWHGSYLHRGGQQRVRNGDPNVEDRWRRDGIGTVRPRPGDGEEYWHLACNLPTAAPEHRQHGVERFFLLWRCWRRLRQAGRRHFHRYRGPQWSGQREAV